MRYRDTQRIRHGDNDLGKQKRQTELGTERERETETERVDEKQRGRRETDTES
jgi:hypothetical protein